MTTFDTTDQAASAPLKQWLLARTGTWRSPLRLRFLLKRMTGAVVAVWGAATIVFLMIFLSGNPAIYLAPETAGREEIAQFARAYGFDRPIWVQYYSFLGNLLSGNFPQSLYTGRPAFVEVFRRVPNTLLLSLSAVCIGSVIGLVLGYWTANSRFIRLREIPILVLMLIQSMPSFLLALVFVTVFSLQLRWLPTSGHTSWLHLILPVSTLALYVVPGVARLFRTSIREVEGEEYLLTMRAMGLSEHRIRLRHIAMNAIGAVIAMIGLQIGGVLAGAVITETVFAWPGVGELLVRSVNNRDYPVVLAAVMVICFAYIIASLIVDIVVAMVNPQGQKSDD